MRKFVLISLLLSTLLSFAEPISNVRALQEGNTIVLLYDLSSNQRVTQVNILINDRHRIIPNQCLSGDIQMEVQAGQDRRIVYDVLADYPDGLQAEVAFMIFTEAYFSSSTSPVPPQPAPQPVPQPTPQPQPALQPTPTPTPTPAPAPAPSPEPTPDPVAPQPIPQPQPAPQPEPQPELTVADNKPVTNHRAVDMGLSVKWAAYNVGANTPLEVGDYFAWGDTAPKANYTQDNYSISQFEDAASAQWGGNWRIPTIAEWRELQENCIWKWGQLDGVYGYKVTSKKNGNSIFLPAAGWKDDSAVNDQNNSGYYWLALPHPNDPNQARSLYFDEERGVGVVNRQCYTGRCLRAVCP